MAHHHQSQANDPEEDHSQAKRSILALILHGLVRAYQLVLSPLLGPRCRFQPTCSHYAIEAIAYHGGVKGGWLTLKRIAKCHPWGGFGYDPVPKGTCNTGTCTLHDGEKNNELSD